MSRITVVIEYADESKEPSFNAGMEILGGEIVAVQFSDALAELERMDDEKTR